MIGGGPGADILQQAMLPVEDHQTCREQMKELLNVKVSKRHMLCAEGQGKGGCQVKKLRFNSYLTIKFLEIRKNYCFKSPQPVAKIYTHNGSVIMFIEQQQQSFI